MSAYSLNSCSVELLCTVWFCTAQCWTRAPGVSRMISGEVASTLTAACYPATLATTAVNWCIATVPWSLREVFHLTAVLPISAHRILRILCSIFCRIYTPLELDVFSLPLAHSFLKCSRSTNCPMKKLSEKCPDRFKLNVSLHTFDASTPKSSLCGDDT